MEQRTREIARATQVAEKPASDPQSDRKTMPRGNHWFFSARFHSASRFDPLPAYLSPLHGENMVERTAANTYGK